ncbi:putative ABC1-domain-containing protein [Lyophyllum shimeji]|uniref:ABC1-domain-containing protein n=1 Tax=Lyophyllum shimeji TaxID=47721 RepID=A0A9P3UU14_LYOSH|nr:putative ABC1-domain-containing protein [Lyophyllum shimeji]
MPPSPAYSWFCVLCSTANILRHAARHRASQLASQSAVCLEHRKETINPQQAKPARPSVPKRDADGPSPSFDILNNQAAAETTKYRVPVVLDQPLEVEPVLKSVAITQVSTTEPTPEDVSVSSLAVSPKSLSAQATTEKEPTKNVSQEFVTPLRNLQSSKVPSSRIGRLFHYGGLAASLGYGAASEIIRRTGRTSNDAQSSIFMTEANIKRLVSKLSQMRGAALKLGQFLSIQDTHVLPAEIDQIFRRVQDSAHYMPDWQMEKVMTASLGPDWTKYFESFERLPFAAASIGQVHGAVLAASISPTGRPEPVAVKIQFPNIVNSIDSDLSYIKILLTAGRLLPKGLFLDRSVQVLKEELADECNYRREGLFATKFGSPSHLGGDSRFKVPWVWEGSTESVLVMERVHGTSVGDADINGLSKGDRDDIAAWILELCLKELFEFRAMQTDPNWSNFLWNAQTRQVELVDFGATREYSKEFMDSWLRLLQAAASEDRDACIQWSQKLGYLTGEENQIMLDAHVDSMILLATPFKSTTAQPFDFGQGSAWSDITAQIRAQIPVMLTHRLTPPPRETYSLNRKLSGTFLLAARLGATINTKAIWDVVVSNYQFTSAVPDDLYVMPQVKRLFSRSSCGKDGPPYRYRSKSAGTAPTDGDSSDEFTYLDALQGWTSMHIPGSYHHACRLKVFYLLRAGLSNALLLLRMRIDYFSPLLQMSTALLTSLSQRLFWRPVLYASTRCKSACQHELRFTSVEVPETLRDELRATSRSTSYISISPPPSLRVATMRPLLGAQTSAAACNWSPDTALGLLSSRIIQSRANPAALLHSAGPRSHLALPTEL